MTSPYKLFATDKNLEAGSGVKLEYDGFSITIHRAGGSNRAFQAALEAKLRPYRRKVEQGTLDPETNRKLLAEVYAETIITSWEGVDDVDGRPLECTEKNVVKLLTDLPDLFSDIISSANDLKNFRAEELAADAKN